MTLKEKVHAYYVRLVDDKVDAFRDMISALTEDSKNDAKGSAGDKHETALSMMHIEQEKFNRKLSECLSQKSVLVKINPHLNHDVVALGSLVKANNTFLYVSVALPKITVDDVVILALSPESPLGTKLIGQKIGSTFEIHSTTYTIHEIY